MISTSLAAIQANDPYCASGIKKLLEALGKSKVDDTEIPLELVLNTIGLSNAIWATKGITGHDRAFRLFACHCASTVLPLFEQAISDDSRPRLAIETAEKFARGEISADELQAFREASIEAAWEAQATQQEIVGKVAWTAHDATNAIASRALEHTVVDATSIAWVQLANVSMSAADKAREAAFEVLSMEFRRMCRLDGKYATNNQ